MAENSLAKKNNHINSFRLISLWRLSILAVMFFASSSFAGQHIDPDLESYRLILGIEGRIVSRGSDTLRKFIQSLSSEFQRIYPQVSFDIETKGSATAPPALLRGFANIGPMSRKMKESEYDLFINRFGTRPVAVGIALDPLSIYVNRANPIDQLSLPELDGIFSKTRKSGYSDDINEWGQVGLAGQWEKKKINIYTRNTFSGTFAYFQKIVMIEGEYKDSIQMQRDSDEVVKKVAQDPGGIGFSGVEYKTEGVRILPLSKDVKGPAFSPSYENVLNNLYPISRPLYIYVVDTPERPVTALVKEFIRFALSREGQLIANKEGYMPLSAEAALNQFKLIKHD